MEWLRIHFQEIHASSIDSREGIPCQEFQIRFGHETNAGLLENEGVSSLQLKF